MTINNQIRDEKLLYDIITEAAKTSALSSGKMHKYEYIMVKKYYCLINSKQLYKLNLFILLWENLLKNK